MAEWDEELDRLHAQNGDLELQVQNLQSELAKVRSQLSTQTATATPAPIPTNHGPIIEAVGQLREAAKRKAGPALIREVRVIADALAKSVTDSG